MRLALLFALAACGDKHHENVCKQAFTKYVTCVEDIRGSNTEKLGPDPDDLAGCAHDDKAVAMYSKCLGEPDCATFIACLKTYAHDSTPSK